MNAVSLLPAADQNAAYYGPGSAVPPRSRLYRLLPCGQHTVLVESLTGYLNRLAWHHHVVPQHFLAQELAPRLRRPLAPQQVSTFSGSGAMSLNRHGALACEWVTLLEDLTGAPDLHQLTLAPWLGDLQPAKLLRAKPAWCAACFAAWRQQQRPIYEPLIWSLQVISLCVRHARFLEDRCPACQRTQAVIRSNRAPDQCAHCQAWLGSTAPPAAPNPEVLAWQTWVWDALDALRSATAPRQVLAWEPFFRQLASCCTTRGDQACLATCTGLAIGQFGTWLHRSHSPILRSILEFCYVCNVTPLQVMAGDLGPLQRVLQTGTVAHPPPPRRPCRPIDLDRCRQRLHAMLDGEEAPLAQRPLAAQMGCSGAALRYNFPRECALLSQRLKDERRQRNAARTARLQQDIRRAALALHAQGLYPSHAKVAALLATPYLFFLPEARATLQAVWQELGWEPVAADL